MFIACTVEVKEAANVIEFTWTITHYMVILSALLKRLFIASEHKFIFQLSIFLSFLTLFLHSIFFLFWKKKRPRERDKERKKVKERRNNYSCIWRMHIFQICSNLHNRLTWTHKRYTSLLYRELLICFSCQNCNEWRMGVMDSKLS
jgi:hypothetical protein